jgi:hypothetical protein
MIRQNIYLKKEDWQIIAYYAVTHYEVDEIMRTLEEAGCRGENFETAYENLSSGNRNTGLCFSGDGISVLVISVPSSKPQFFNSLVHELHHAATHIAKDVGYDLTGEDVCYLAGEIAEKMYPVIGKYLCQCCSKK